MNQSNYYQYRYHHYDSLYSRKSSLKDRLIAFVGGMDSSSNDRWRCLDSEISALIPSCCLFSALPLKQQGYHSALLSVLFEGVFLPLGLLWSPHDRQIKLSSSSDFVDNWTKHGWVTKVRHLQKFMMLVYNLSVAIKIISSRYWKFQ